MPTLQPPLHLLRIQPAGELQAEALDEKKPEQGLLFWNWGMTGG